MGAAAGTASGGTLAEAQPVGVYRPRQPRASPLYRLLDEHFRTFTTVYDERFAPRWGPWRRVVAEVVEKFVACGILSPLAGARLFPARRRGARRRGLF